MAIDAIVPRSVPDDTAPETADLAALLALTLAPGTRALIVGGTAVPGLDTRVADRGTQRTDVASIEAAAAKPAGAFDAVVIASGFEGLNDPVAALEHAQSLLGPDGRLVLTAQNAASARARMRLLVGAGQCDGALPPRQYDLAALQRVVGAAGLSVRTCLRVIDTEPIESAELSAETSKLLAEGAEARALAYVVVATRTVEGASASQSLEELLQRQIDGIARKLAHATADLGASEHERKQLEDRINEIQRELDGALAENDDQRRELDARADALAERIELVERLHRERRHLELDVAVKDDYIVDLRLEFTDMLNRYNALLWKHEALLRSRHYKVAKLLHRAVRQVPLVHRVAQWVTNRGMRLARHVRPLPPSED